MGLGDYGRIYNHIKPIFWRDSENRVLIFPILQIDLVWLLISLLTRFEYADIQLLCYR